MEIGIIGNGFVGKATSLLKNKDIDTIIYDIKTEYCDPPGTRLSNLYDCKFIFICVPTPIIRKVKILCIFTDATPPVFPGHN